MPIHRWIFAATCLALAAGRGPMAKADNWPQFRGPGGSGVSRGEAPLPGELSVERHLLWKTPLGKGHSSPVVWGDRVYLTALEDERLLTLALDAEDGRIVWEAEAEYDELERVHGIGSPATPSVATDGEVVVSFFGSSGLHAYDPHGELLWKRAMGPFDNSFGAASSPVLVEGLAVMVQDHDTGAFLAAFDKRTGEEVWRVERGEFRRNYSTPLVWRQGDEAQIVVAGTAQVNAYDAKTGKHLWAVLRGARVVSATPVVGADGRLYVVNSGGGEAPNQPTFADLLARADANGNGMMEKEELPGSVIRSFLDQFDRDKNGSLSEEEYETIRRTMAYASPIAMAIEPGGRGDITDSHVAWSGKRSIPRNPSPLVVEGLLFAVQDSGVVTVRDTATGEEVGAGRLQGSGKFFSSPVYGDGKIYAVSETGKLNAITAEADWRQLGAVDLAEDVYASPAIADGHLYVRTVSHLYCFGVRN